MVEFRGISNNKWIYGSLITYPDQTGIVVFTTDATLSITGTEYKVDLKTVGQLYSTRDSEENKIYEGDIVEYDNSNYGYGTSTPEKLTMVVPSINDFLMDKTVELPEYILMVIRNGIKVGSIHDKHLKEKNE